MKKYFDALYINVYNKFKDTKTPHLVDWAILIAFCFLLFITHMYWDLAITTKHGVNFWYALEHGKLLNFYSFNINAAPSNPLFKPGTAVYDFLVYVIFAIWNFPLYILEKFFHVKIFTSIPCLLWAKLILIPFLLATTYIIYKICIELKITKNNAKWAMFIFLSSGFVFSSLFVNCQYDIISILFILLGILMYLKGKTKKFVFWFAIAISFKLFALLVFIPLILLKEKKIIKLLGYGFISISLTLAQKIIFIFFDKATVSAQAFSSNLIMSKIFNNQLPIGLKTISIYTLAFVGLCIFCFVKIIKDQEELNKYAIYIPFASFALFFMLTPALPYWFILLTPYFPIMIFLNKRNFKVNLILDTVLSFSMIVVLSIKYYWCYGINTIEPMVFPRLFGGVGTLVKPIDAGTLYFKIISDYGVPVLSAIFTICLIAILILNYPKNESDSTEIVIERSVIWSRLFICAGVCLVPLFTYFISLIVFGVK